MTLFLIILQHMLSTAPPMHGRTSIGIHLMDGVTLKAVYTLVSLPIDW